MLGELDHFQPAATLRNAPFDDIAEANAEQRGAGFRRTANHPVRQRRSWMPASAEVRPLLDKDRSVAALTPALLCAAA
jgi:hypothetical protein